MDQTQPNIPAEGRMANIYGKKKLLIIGLTAVILIALAAGAYFYFFQGGKEGGKTNNNINSEAITNERSGENPTDNAVNVGKTRGDEDRDGLSDVEEKELGTDPQKSDTDADGLSDYEEVKVYKTDPLKSDTDGDSYLDGDEVSRNYDPNGPGKLLDLNKGIDNLPNTNQ